MDVNNIHKYTAKRLVILRNKNHMSLSQLAKEVGVDRSYIHRVEKCDLKANPTKLPKVCVALGICLRDFEKEVKEDGDG